MTLAPMSPAQSARVDRDDFGPEMPPWPRQRPRTLAGDRTPKPGIKHGTSNGYNHHRCRCPDCTDANRCLYHKRTAGRVKSRPVTQIIAPCKPVAVRCEGCGNLVVVAAARLVPLLESGTPTAPRLCAGCLRGDT